MSISVARLMALIKKETHQLLRDKSSLAIGLILPIILILLFGYGLSFDLNNGRVGVVVQNVTPQSNQLISGLNGTRYITAVPYTSFAQAEQAMGRAEIDAIVNVPADFAQASTNQAATIQIITNGRSTSIASALQGYISGALTTAQAIQSDRQNMQVLNSDPHFNWCFFNRFINRKRKRSGNVRGIICHTSTTTRNCTCQINALYRDWHDRYWRMFIGSSIYF